MKSKKFFYKFIIVFLMLIEISTIFLMYKSLYSYDNVNEKIFSIDDLLVDELIAILVETDNGSYSEYEGKKWPTSGYIYNEELSGCVDRFGNKISGILSYNKNTNQAIVNTTTTTHCYLYFEKDTTPTNNSILINDNATYTTSTSVTLTLSSTGATEMCISNTETCNDWEKYNTTKTYTLTNTLGAKTVYVWYKSEKGSISDAKSDTISLYEVLTVPSQSGSLTYTGSSQSPSWINYSSSKMTIGGTTSGTNAGTYNATFTPKTNYIWSDGTTTAKTASWKINKAVGSLTLSSSSGTITGVGNTKTFTVTRAGDGKISVSSSNTGVATVSVSGTTVTVKAVAKGSATITVSVAAGTNHTSPSSKTYSVSVSAGNYLYNAGNQYTSLTGGWITDGWKRVPYQTHKEVELGLTYGSSYLQATLNNAGHESGALHISKNFNFSGISKLYLDCEITYCTQTFVDFIVVSRDAGAALDPDWYINTVNIHTIKTTTNTPMSRRTVTLDVSTYSGSSDIVILMSSNWKNTSNCTFRMYSLRAE